MSRYNPTYFNPELWISIWWAAGETPPASLLFSLPPSPSLPSSLTPPPYTLAFTTPETLEIRTYGSFLGEGGHILDGDGAVVNLTLRAVKKGKAGEK